MAFDIAGAKAAGYSDAEIADHLAAESKFDAAAARKAGYSDAEILQHLAPAPAAPKQQGTGSDLIDSGNAVGTGYGRGLLRLIGAPVDAVANVRDLLKAGAGSAYIAATGKPPPDWLEVGNRANDVGSGDNLIAGARKAGAGLLVDPVNPDYEGGYLQNAGGALTAIMGPRTLPQLINQGAIGTASATAGKAVADATGNPALAAAAALTPLAAQNVLTGATKIAVRGNDGGEAMRQRMQDLSNAGVENPTLGLASGNKIVSGVENLLTQTPGASGRMNDARDRIVNALQAKTTEVADTASTNRGALEAGTAIQSGAKQFKESQKATQASLYNALDSHIPPQTPVNVAGTKATLANINADIPGAPELSKQFKNSRIVAIEDAMKSDTAGTPPGSMLTIKGGGGIMNAPVVTATTPIPGWSSTDVLPFQAVKQTRTLVGNEIADNSLMSNVPRSKWNPFYGALSEDLQGAAQAAGPQAETAFNRATDFTRAGINRMERIAPIVDRPAPEQSFTALANTLKENGSTFQAVKKSLPQDARGAVAGTVIERLGKAKNGVQNDAGDVWSPETFLSNWNAMSPKGKTELLSGFKNADEVRSSIEAVAKATSMMRDGSKMWANPSGTAANTMARNMLLGGGLAGFLNPWAPFAVGTGLTVNNAFARAATSPRVVNAFAEPNHLNPEALRGQINAVIGSDALNTERGRD